MSEEDRSADVGEMEIELPPALVQWVDDMEVQQRKLLKDKAFDNPAQLRKFVATTVMEMVVRVMKMIGTTMYDTHQLGVSNATQLQHMRRWTAEHLRKLGAEVSDGEAFAGVDMAQLNEVAQAFYALGSYLQAKYPTDEEAKQKFNDFAELYTGLIETLMGNQAVDDGEDEDEDDEDDEDGGESDGEDASSSDEPAADAPASGDPEVAQ